MRDLLVRYLLGELEAEDRLLLEERLRGSSELRRQLAYLRECLPSAAEQHDPAGEPPSGLAERTVERISGLDSGVGAASLAAAPAGAHAQDGNVEPAAGTPYWSFVDLIVAGGVLLAVSMLFLPVLRQSRDASRRTVCADNLRQLGVMLAAYSEEHGHFPLVRQNDNAGIFAVHLVDKGYVEADRLVRLVVCLGSPLAEEIAAGRVIIRIPSVAELQAAAGEELAEMRRYMGGSLAYRLGYVEGPHYYNIPDEGCSRTPLMADAPSFQLANLRSANHDDDGQNVLCQAGGVVFTRPCKLSDREDHLYLNDKGEPAAGCGRSDTVLGSSGTMPGVFAIEDAGEITKHE